MNKNKKSIKTFIYVIITLLIIAVLAVVVYIFLDVFHNQKTISSAEEISDYLNINIKNIEAEDIKYYIENEDIARAEYQKASMSYILKSSENVTKDVVNNNHKWGQKILMYCKLENGDEIEVISCLDEDNLNVMKAEWTYNGKYYGMMTENLVTREEFLQEVNRVVIANCKEDEQVNTETESTD